MPKARLRYISQPFCSESTVRKYTRSKILWDLAQIQHGPLTFCANIMKFPSLILVWVGTLPSWPSFQATGRAIILVSSFLQKVKFSKAISGSMGIVYVGESAWGTLQLPFRPYFPCPSSFPLELRFIRTLHFVFTLSFPQQLKITCDSHKWFKLLSTRQECWALPVDILGSQERDSRQEVSCGLESGELHRHPENIPECRTGGRHVRSH